MLLEQQAQRAQTDFANMRFEIVNGGIMTGCIALRADQANYNYQITGKTIHHCDLRIDPTLRYLFTNSSKLGRIIPIISHAHTDKTHLSPLGAASSIKVLNSFKSSLLNSTAPPPIFSFNLSGLLVPGMGIAP
jgi:hypothetical protein